MIDEKRRRVYSSKAQFSLKTCKNYYTDLNIPFMISKIVCGADKDSCYGHDPKKEIRRTIMVKKSLRAAEDDLSNDLRIGMNRFLSEISKAKCNGVWCEKFLK